MDFSNLLELAKENKGQQPVKGFSTKVTPAKKPPRNNVPSAAVQKFLQKKEQEERRKEEDARRQKEQLLALRATNSKSNKKAKLMASRTKDNDFSKIRLTEDEIVVKQKMEAEMRRQMLTDKVERMKARIKFQEHEQQQPHKRKRKPKVVDPNAPPDKATKFEEEWNLMMKKRMPEKSAKRANKQSSSSASQRPLSFNELLELASKKQHEPEPEPGWEDFEEDEEEFVEEVKPTRPMTKVEQVKAMEEHLYVKRKEQKANMQKQNAPNRPVSNSERPKIPAHPTTSNPARDNQQRPVPSYRTTTNGHPNNGRIPKRPAPPTDPNSESIPSYSTIRTSKTVEQRNEELFKEGRLKAKRGTKNLMPKKFNEPVSSPPSSSMSAKKLPPDSSCRGPVPSYNTVKKPVTQNGQIDNRLSRPGVSSKGPGQNGQHDNRLSRPGVSPKGPGQNGQLDNRLSRPGVSPKGPVQNGQLENRPGASLKRRSQAPQQKISGPPRPPGNPNLNRSHPVKSNPYENADTKPAQSGEYDPSSPGFNSSSSRSNPRGPPPRPPLKSTKEVQREKPSAAVRNKVPAGVSPDNMRPARFNETANGLMHKKVSLPPSSKMPMSKFPVEGRPMQKGPGQRPPAERMAQSNKGPPQRLPPRPPENRFTSRVPTHPRKISAPSMRHEMYPNLARNPYKKLPPITSSRPHRIESSDEEEEDDDDMKDFIDDEPNQEIDYSQHIKEIFGYDKSKYMYADDEYDDEVVESSFAEQMKEENRSARIAMQEDYEEMVKEMEEQKRKGTKKKLK